MTLRTARLQPKAFPDWWRQVESVALVGTARRPVPEPPVIGSVSVGFGADLRSEEALLMAAALGSAARQAGRRPERLAAAPPAPPDDRPAAGRRATHLLELIITQPPAGAQQRTELIRHWLRAADVAGRRLPHALLPTILEAATTVRELRAPTAAVLDARGQWLAAQRPDWSWVPDALAGAQARSAASELSEAEWARLPSPARLSALARLRTDDPAAGRALVASTWRTDSARDRTAHLESLRIGLGPADEPLLEAALDDRAGAVRDAAAALLDALPESARARRMADRLRPLIHVRGARRRTLEITLPDEPDPTGVRDGLHKPPPRRSARGWWLERIVAGAPLGTWEAATGWDPATTVSRLSDEDALSGIRHAARLRKDPVWAAALLARSWDPALVAALPAADREDAVLDRFTADPKAAVASLLASVPTPWSARFSLAVLARLGAEKAAALTVTQAVPHLVHGLHPEALPALEAWLARVRQDSSLATHLRNVLQFHSVKRSISEAFR